MTNSRMTPRRLLLLAFLSLLPPVSLAQQASHPCATVPDPDERLACYDKAFPPPQETIEAAKEQARSRFGLDFLKPKQASATPAPDQIEGKVVRVDSISGGLRRFTLDNGQVWTQTDDDNRGHLREGETVRIRKAILGGYHLVMPNGIVVRVRRTR